MTDTAANRVLEKMLDRLFAAIASGPSLNCRPHSSRQRIDLMQLSKLQDHEPDEVLRALLGADARCRLTGRAKPLPRRVGDHPFQRRAAAPAEPEPETDEQKRQREAWSDQASIMTKLQILAEEARTYENDTGSYVLNLGFPLLSLPPGVGVAGQRSGSRRILAPVAYIPVALTVSSGAAPSVTLACKEDEIDRVVPNTALLAWIERQTGKPIEELFEDDQGAQPWREIAHLVRHVAQRLEIATPPAFAGDEMPEDFTLTATPRSEDLAGEASVIAAAVLGLFPLANEGLLRDTQAMLEGEALDGPVESFIRAGVSLDQPPAVDDDEPEATQKRPRRFADERLIADADPCQSRAVALARECRGLVMHGPPGTGKSQTITNIIGDHLARGQRVLFVCDKRTALDVVANRLEHLGLGGLCALVHDPHRDQRDLYKSIREQLENLPEAITDAGADKDVEKFDRQLQKAHDELTEQWTVLMAADEHGLSFHNLMGQWLAIDADPLDLNADATAELTPELLETHETETRTLLEHALRVDFPANPWRKAAGIALRDLLTRPMDTVRSAMDRGVEAAGEADATADANIPPFGMQPSLREQAEARAELAGALQAALAVDATVRRRWAGSELEAQRSGLRLLHDAQPHVQTLKLGPMDTELVMIARDQPLTVTAVAQHMGVLDAWLAVASKWYGFLAFSKKSAAAKVLRQFGLTVDADSGTRLHEFLKRLRARMVLSSIHHQLAATEPQAKWEPDEQLSRALADHEAVLSVLVRVQDHPALQSTAKGLLSALHDEGTDAAEALVAGLRASPLRADGIEGLIDSLVATQLFSPAFLESARKHLLAGELIADDIAALRDRIDDLESVLRVLEVQVKLPPALRAALEKLLARSLAVDSAMGALRKAALAAEISRRIRANPLLQDIDGQRIETSLNRYRELDQRKKQRVRDAILHRWVTTQKQRLLVGTGSRLNGAGADMRRRLTMRGENALRLRQVVSIGQSTEGGDPLFDLRPVWMASPETVAQIFPRKPHFDVVVFDEASQCRLEEALPVLTRARRVVIAGDPKQLPPTRFFESAVAASEQEEIENDQQLFEIQQAEVEDLLTAALSLEVQSAYLDVHYRSSNADLIAFSNEQFYHARLQPIPGHPSNRARFAPLTLNHAGGVYEDRTNPIEADHVCRIVRDLLRRADPPSIGIACFNLSQRDLIAEKLDELAVEDADFGRKLAEARTRRGAASFEGLFVKNLENVQGDERDHIIISTTYGPDAKGRFYRRFGPLGRAGGGRRLNVLVTRARQEVHLVTSIPAEVYRALPPIPPGQTAGGGWLLFAYLHFAEKLAEAYEEAHRILEDSRAAETAHVWERSSAYPSAFAAAIAHRLARGQNIGSDVHWGNDGFCVDLALHHPVRAEDRTLGILCDATRFTKAEDPVEWEAFRTNVLEAVGWQLHRLWTPQFFRDPSGSLAAIRQRVDKMLASESDPDAIAVRKPPKG